MRSHVHIQKIQTENQAAKCIKPVLCANEHKNGNNQGHTECEEDSLRIIPPENDWIECQRDKIIQAEYFIVIPTADQEGDTVGTHEDQIIFNYFGTRILEEKTIE